MTIPGEQIFGSIRRYAAKARDVQREFRLTHFMYSLPEDIRRDIWADRDRPMRGR